MKREGKLMLPSLFLYHLIVFLSYCHNVTQLGLAQDVAYKERLNKNVA